MKKLLVLNAVVLVACALGGTSINELAAADQPKPSTNDASSRLSVAPLDHLVFPDDRPHWIDSTGEAKEADAGVISIAVVSPPQSTPDAAAEMMEVMARGAVENYIDQQASLIDEPIDSKEISVEMDWIRDELIVRRYDGKVRSGESTLHESACLLQITQADRDILDRLIDNHRLIRRLGAVGVVSLAGFMSLVGGSILLGGLATHRERRKAA